MKFEAKLHEGTPYTVRMAVTNTQKVTSVGEDEEKLAVLGTAELGEWKKEPLLCSPPRRSLMKLNAGSLCDQRCAPGSASQKWGAQVPVHQEMD